MPRSREPVLSQILTVAQMRAAEEALIAGGSSVDALMQMAGRGAGEWVRRIAAGRPVTVLCGPGNNGGDGYVIAQYLYEHGTPVQVIAARAAATDAARKARSLYQGAYAGDENAPHGEVLVDCLFGSGLTRALPDDLLALLTGLAAHHHQRIAIDLPSGIDSDTGQPLNDGLPQWTLTVALGAWKFAHWTLPAAAAMGALRLVDIGVAPVPGAAQVLAKPRIAAPAVDAHKYRRGLLGIVAGAMPGATLLAADAAMRAGAGYVKLAADARPEGVPHDLVCSDALDEVLADKRVAALLVGPGLGRDDAAAARLGGVLDVGAPCVIDADALMLLTPAMPRAMPRVLTPHEGEMAALEQAFGLSGQGLRRERALALAAASGAVVVFKGPDSVIATPGGMLLAGPCASSWLSVAGTGDVLAGVIASRLAVHGDALRAAREGLWLHGAAARIAGPVFTASGLAHAVRAAVQEVLS